MIVVKNANAIAPSKSRFYNLKGEVEKFIGKNIKITSNNDDFVMQGVFNESESTLVVTRSRLPSFSRVTPMEESDSEAGNLEKVSVDLALKSNGMAQVTILNNTENAIDCSDLTIKVLNFLGNSICKVLVHKRHGIEPGKSSKFNIALNAAHLKHPFQLVLTNSDFRAVSDLSMKNLSGDFKVERGWSITNSKSPERSISEFDGSSSSTESEINESEFENFSKNNIGSTSSMVLPSLPKESIEKLSTSVYIDAKLDAERREEMGSVTESETDRSSRSPFQDKDQDMLIDVSDTDDFELGSDYEILTPTVSNYNYAG
ncbi:hypothetical protein CANTEDRAFT_94821 [Yamadazyma tenuis ATCC 10573]|nr:uncharacterized protein CANTEDRAFT_94821 [Yamadazyma tenuis ATCC 10573]EGV61943.1 hypothetical protein CANTEDRAFT_94821 [Yamadazyma tenuis ATCC 10573]